MNFLSKLFLPITAPIRFIQNNFKTVLFLSVVFFIFSNSNSANIQQPNLQIISLSGPILDATDILSKIEKAKNDKNIKGVLLKVNSPGGSVPPSIEIAYAIKELKATKPVVAYASGIMASGSYYASIWASKIIANPGSLVGSIGVIMQSADISKLLDKVGIKPQTVKMGDYKEAGTPTRKWTKAERAELQKITKNTYDMFVSDVANARGLNVKDDKVFANAHIFTSNEAKKVGLIDEVATISYAKAQLILLSKVNNPIWSKEDKIEKLMQKMLQGSISAISSNYNNLLAY